MTLHGQGVEGLATVVRGPYLEHPCLPGFDVDLDFGDVCGERVGGGDSSTGSLVDPPHWRRPVGT